MQLSHEAICYSWRQLAHRAGVNINNQDKTGFESLGLPVHYGQPEAPGTESPSIFVIPVASNTWEKLLIRPNNSLDWIAVDKITPPGVKLSFDHKIPILFWGDGYEDNRKPFVEKLNDNTIVFYADIISATFFMLTRWEEVIIPDRDKHERFPASASVAYRQSFLDIPIVDVYSLILQTWLKIILPGWEPLSKRFTIRMTHDIHTVRSANILRLGGDLFKRRNLKLANKTLSELIFSEYDDAWSGIGKLMNLSEANGMRDAFYFMAANRSRWEVGLDPNSLSVQSVIKELRYRGHEVGFHPGYFTYDDFDRFMLEKGRLDRALNETKYGGRQHYLRFRVPITWRLWEQAGLSYDSTMGYADHEGFRCGTCYPYFPFDIEQNRQFEIIELPLIVMDGTINGYREISLEVAEKSIRTLANRCKSVHGDFTMLWHNNTHTGDWKPWFDMYRRLLSYL